MRCSSGIQIVLLGLSLSLALAGCASRRPQLLSLTELYEDQGYVALRIYSAEMEDRPRALWGIRARLFYRPIDAGSAIRGEPPEASPGSFVSIGPGESTKLVVLKLPAGAYEFHRVMVEMQEEKIAPLRFEVRPRLLSYAGDLQLDVGLSRSSGVSNRSSGVQMQRRWDPEATRAALRAQYPLGRPELYGAEESR